MNASQSRSKTTIVDGSPICKRSKHYQDIKELLLLHRRYEANALCSLRRATMGLNLAEKRPRRTRRRTQATHAEGGGTSVLHEAEERPPLRTKKGDSLSKDRRLIDSEYLSQIMSRIDGNMELSLAECSPAPKANTLRLPKFKSIPQEGKAIFYTSLPSIPVLPRLKEHKTIPRSVKRIFNRKYHKSDTSQYSLPDNCLTVCRLPGDQCDFDAVDAVKLTNDSSEESPPLQITAPLGVTSTERHHKVVNEELYWLVPVLENEPYFRLNKTVGNGVKKDGALHKDSKRHVKRRDATEENTTPKYKRNVHFSEILHEVHLYTPMSTKH